MLNYESTKQLIKVAGILDDVMEKFAVHPIVGAIKRQAESALGRTLTGAEHGTVLKHVEGLTGKSFSSNKFDAANQVMNEGTGRLQAGLKSKNKPLATDAKTQITNANRQLGETAYSNFNDKDIKGIMGGMDASYLQRILKSAPQPKVLSTQDKLKTIDKTIKGGYKPANDYATDEVSRRIGNLRSGLDEKGQAEAQTLMDQVQGKVKAEPTPAPAPAQVTPQDVPMNKGLKGALIAGGIGAPIAAGGGAMMYSKNQQEQANTRGLTGAAMGGIGAGSLAYNQTQDPLTSLLAAAGGAGVGYGAGHSQLGKQISQLLG
jgi:hypothetical protein